MHSYYSSTLFPMSRKTTEYIIIAIQLSLISSAQCPDTFVLSSHVIFEAADHSPQQGSRINAIGTRRKIEVMFFFRIYFSHHIQTQCFGNASKIRLYKWIQCPVGFRSLTAELRSKNCLRLRFAHKRAQTFSQYLRVLAECISNICIGWREGIWMRVFECIISYEFGGKWWIFSCCFRAMHFLPSRSPHYIPTGEMLNFLDWYKTANNLLRVICSASAWLPHFGCSSENIFTPNHRT